MTKEVEFQVVSPRFHTGQLKLEYSELLTRMGLHCRLKQLEVVIKYFYYFFPLHTSAKNHFGYLW